MKKARPKPKTLTKRGLLKLFEDGPLTEAYRLEKEGKLLGEMWDGDYFFGWIIPKRIRVDAPEIHIKGKRVMMWITKRLPEHLPGHEHKKMVQLPPELSLSAKRRNNQLKKTGKKTPSPVLCRYESTRRGF